MKLKKPTRICESKYRYLTTITFFPREALDDDRDGTNGRSGVRSHTKCNLILPAY